MLEKIATNKKSLLKPAIIIYLPVINLSYYWDQPENTIIRSFQYKWLENLFYGILLGLIFVMIGLILKDVKWLKDLENEFKNILGKLTIPNIIILALLSGFAEEMLFRVLLQNYTGVFIASLLFGLLHFPLNKKMIPWTVFALMVGFIFGLVMQYTGRVSLVIYAHITVNFLNFLRIAR